MSGLLDFAKSPEGFGLLSAVAGGLATARRGEPWNNLGRAGASGLLGYSTAMNQQRNEQNDLVSRQMHQMQYDMTKRDYDKQKWLEDTASQFYRPGQSSATNALALGAQNGSIGPTVENAQRIDSTPATQGGFDQAGYMQAVMQRYPQIGLEMQAKLKAANQVKLGKDEKIFDVGTGKTLFDNTIPEIKEGYLVRGSDGQWSADPKLYQLALDANRAKGTQITMPSITLNTEKTYAGNIAEGVAKNDLAAIEAAQGAGERIKTARQVKALLQQSPITGTGAEWRLGATKALATAGIIDGSTVKTTEDLASLLAGSTLDAIKTSGLGSGQGFTDKDRQFLERARSGSIELNSGTLQTLADLNERAGMASIKRGQEVAERFKKNPALGTVGQQFNFDVPSPEPAKSTARVPLKGQVVDGWKFRGGNPADPASWERK